MILLRYEIIYLIYILLKGLFIPCAESAPLQFKILFPTEYNKIKGMSVY
jgi:hypothetical protein